MTNFLKLREYPLFETSLLFLMSYSAFLLAEFVVFTGLFDSPLSTEPSL